MKKSECIEGSISENNTLKTLCCLTASSFLFCGFVSVISACIQFPTQLLWVSQGLGQSLDRTTKKSLVTKSQIPQTLKVHLGLGQQTTVLLEKWTKVQASAAAADVLTADNVRYCATFSGHCKQSYWKASSSTSSSLVSCQSCSTKWVATKKPAYVTNSKKKVTLPLYCGISSWGA